MFCYSVVNLLRIVIHYSKYMVNHPKNLFGLFLTFRVISLSILNLWFAKPMVWVRVAFHENDGNHENDENDEDNSDSYKQGVECWIRGNHGNHENDENHENPGCKPRVPQTTGLEIPDFRDPPKISFKTSTRLTILRLFKKRNLLR